VSLHVRGCSTVTISGIGGVRLQGRKWIQLPRSRDLVSGNSRRTIRVDVL